MMRLTDSPAPVCPPSLTHSALTQGVKALHHQMLLPVVRNPNLRLRRSVKIQTFVQIHEAQGSRTKEPELNVVSDLLNHLWVCFRVQKMSQNEMR